MKTADKKARRRRLSRPQRDMHKENGEAQLRSEPWREQRTAQAMNTQPDHAQTPEPEEIEITLDPAPVDPDKARHASTEALQNLGREIDELKRQHRETHASLAREVAGIREMLLRQDETARTGIDELRQGQAHHREKIQHLADDFVALDTKLEEKLVFTVEHLQKAIDRMLPAGKKPVGESKPAATMPATPAPAVPAKTSKTIQTHPAAPVPAMPAAVTADDMILRLKGAAHGARIIRRDQAFTLELVFEASGLAQSQLGRLHYHADFYAKKLGNGKRETVAEARDGVSPAAPIAIKTEAKALSAGMYRLEAAFSLRWPERETAPKMILVDCGLLHAY